MTPPDFNERLLGAWRELLELNAERALAEAALESSYREATEDATRRRDENAAEAERRFAADTADAERARAEGRRGLEERAAADRRHEDEFRDRELERIEQKAEANARAGRKKLDEQIWLAETVFEGHEGQPRQELEKRLVELAAHRERIGTARQEIAALLARRRQRRLAARAAAVRVFEAQPDDEDDVDEGDGDGDEAVEGTRPPSREALARAADEAEAALSAIRADRLSRLFVGPTVPILAVAALGAAVALTGWRAGWAVTPWLAVVPGGVLVLLVLLALLLHALSRSRLRPRALRVAAIDAGADDLHERSVARARRDCARTIKRLESRRDRDIAKARAKLEPIIDGIAERVAHHRERIEQSRAERRSEIESTLEAGLAEVEAAYAEATKDARATRDAALAEIEAAHEAATRGATEAYESGWSALRERWTTRSRAVHEVIASSSEACARAFPPWDDAAWRDWSPSDGFPPMIPFGALDVDVEALEGGRSEDERLPMPWPVRFTVPAALAFPDDCSVLIEHGEDGGDVAVSLLHVIMFRLLTALPPGKARFTIVDPVGLGQNFAGFMHLADAMEALVTDRIWTDVRHIEQRLADLTEHMETVIQKYLRNEYETIAAYNEEAGEIAEPYRFLVIAGFPANFSEAATRRLASIVSSGARCGVHVLIAWDTREEIPKGLDATDLRRRAIHLVHGEHGLRWMDRGADMLPLRPDPPPPPALMAPTLNAVGAAAKDANRVEVPFETIMPPDDGAWWTRRSDEALRVPLGRTGARSLQHLDLGHGTSQHALVAGKTGSGKSTLLHVLVASVAAWFSPDEVELYLVDFKKGVEFKPYAALGLPHARAVAIESDREFALSVLRRLDGELKRRGDLFRAAGVPDLASYRGRDGHEPMPRTLLVIDEFQEFFVEDDKIGQDAALLLDRLVRQGRAFGIHVVLGSQTLGGAYSLAKSTMGQMAVRIALQCSEADSYLILNEDNAAARLLARPGEAIYNDAAGRVEGNSPFQIVWLPEQVRERVVRRAVDLAAARGWRPPEPMIVFEGNVAAEIERNRALDDLLSGRAAPSGPPRAWLGEPVAIRDSTAAEFRRQSGANVLIVGQQDESALAMCTTGLVSLAATAPGATVHVLDGTPSDAPRAGHLAGVAARLPIETTLIGRGDLAEGVDAVAGIVDRRLADDVHDAPPVFLVIFGLQRFRDLRQADEFGFSSDPEATPGPDKRFAHLLQEGPAVGVHVIAWCDTAANVDRALGRRLMREFDQRVVMQMSATDSTNLIDTPLANKLGLRHALLFSDERGTVEKFRPYGLPTDAWLEGALKGAVR